MTIITPTSIAGITSITAQSGSLNFYTAAGNNLPISAATLNVGTGASVSSPANNVLVLGTNNTEAVRVGSTGFVGIGTNNSSSKLQVQGTIGFGASDDLESGFPGGRTKLTSSASGFVINHNDNSSIIFQNQGVERVCIKSDGKTGINNTNPLSTLSVGTRTSDVSDSSLIFTAGGSSSGGEVLAATFCNTAAGASNNATAISFTCRSGDSQTAKIVAMQPSGASSPNTQLDFYVYNNSGLTKIVTFDQNGRVTTPYQPRAHIRKTGGSTLTTTPAVIPFETETYDTANNFSSNRFTAPISGYYLVTVNVNILATTNTVGIDIRLNGNVYGNMNYSFTAGNIRTNYTMTGVVYAATNDYIEIYGYVNTSTVGVDNAGHLSIALLG